MAQYITKIRTESGDKQIDYTQLANLPSIDASLSKSGAFADAKAVGDAISSANEAINNITPENIGAVPVIRKINGKDLSSDIILSASDVGASASDHIHDDKYYTESEIDTKLGEKSDTNHTHKYAGSSSVGGSANSAVKLATARTICTNLASTTAASFDGSGNVSPGVSGALPIKNGGTGATDVASALVNLGLTKYYASAISREDKLSITRSMITPLTLNDWKVNSGNLFTFSDGCIVMPKDGIVFISASIYYDTPGTGDRGPENVGVYIKNNGEEIFGQLTYSNSMSAVSLAPFITTVNKGDKLSLCARNGTADGTCVQDNIATALTVIYL